MAGQRVTDGRGDRLVLNFHGLGPVPATVGDDERPYWCAADRFATELDTIVVLSHRSDLPIEITFDDGNASDTEIALPALLERSLTASFFMCAGRIGTAGYVDATVIRELASAGMGIGSHGWSHVDWRTIDDGTLRHEVDDARTVLAEALGGPIHDVAIPFGSYDRRVLRHLRRSGFRTVFTSDAGRAPRSGWMVPREAYTTDWAADTLSGLVADDRPLTWRLRRTAVGTLKRLR